MTHQKDIPKGKRTSFWHSLERLLICNSASNAVKRPTLNLFHLHPQTKYNTCLSSLMHRQSELAHPGLASTSLSRSLPSFKNALRLRLGLTSLTLLGINLRMVFCKLNRFINVNNIRLDVKRSSLLKRVIN